MKFNIAALTFVGKVEGFECADKYDLIGGGEVYLYDLAQFLIKEGHDVTVIQPWDKNETLEFEDINIKGIKLPKVFKSHIEYGFCWKKYIDQDADIVHLHNFDHGYPFENNTMTGTCHGVNWDCPKLPNTYNKTIYEKYLPSIKKEYVKYRVRHSVKNLKKIASVDSFLLRYIQSEMPEYRNKIEVIPNYVDTEIFNPNISSSQLREKYGAERTIILFPRNISYVRGIHITLEAIKILSAEYPEILLLVTGYGPQHKWAINYIKENNLDRNVLFVGHKDHFKDMPTLYSVADIIIIPTFCSEGTSLSCLEAMASKKPVIVTRVGGLIDIVIDGYNGLICNPNTESLKDNIKVLLDDEHLRDRLSKNALSWVEQKHNYTNWTKSYKDFFDI